MTEIAAGGGRRQRLRLDRLLGAGRVELQLAVLVLRLDVVVPQRPGQLGGALGFLGPVGAQAFIGNISSNIYGVASRAYTGTGTETITRSQPFSSATSVGKGFRSSPSCTCTV